MEKVSAKGMDDDLRPECDFSGGVRGKCASCTPRRSSRRRGFPDFVIASRRSLRISVTPESPRIEGHCPWLPLCATPGGYYNLGNASSICRFESSKIFHLAATFGLILSQPSRVRTSAGTSFPAATNSRIASTYHSKAMRA